MSQKFNRGRGAYLCDQCEKPIWSGHDGKYYETNRKFSFDVKREDVASWSGFYYCSKECMYAFRYPKEKGKKE